MIQPPASRRTAEATISLAASLIGIATFIVTVCVATAATIGGWSDVWRWASVILLSVAVGGALGFGISLWIVRSRPSKGYRILSIEQTYEFLEENTRVQRQVARIVIQATRPGVYLFVDRTKWTGSKRPMLSAPRNGQALWAGPFRAEGWDAYVIALQQPLVKGETTEIVLQAEYHSISDDEYQWTAKTPTERICNTLTLRLAMGRNLPPVDRFWAGILVPGTGDREVVKRLAVAHDPDLGHASVTFRRPKLGALHRLRVDFKHDSRAAELDGIPVGRDWGSI